MCLCSSFAHKTWQKSEFSGLLQPKHLPEQHWNSTDKITKWLEICLKYRSTSVHEYGKDNRRLREKYGVFVEQSKAAFPNECRTIEQVRRAGTESWSTGDKCWRLYEKCNGGEVSEVGWGCGVHILACALPSRWGNSAALHWWII